jgi:hypothetical protein
LVQRGGDAPSSFSHPFFPLLLSSLSRQQSKGKGGNPKAVGGCPAEARPRGVDTRSRRRKGKEGTTLGDWTHGRRGDVAACLWLARPLSAWLQRAKGSFPPGRFPGERAGTGSASGPAGQPAVPSGARTGAAGRARTSVEGERGEEERVKGTDRDAPPVVERKRENEPGTRWAAVTGWLSWWCWAGC